MLLPENTFSCIIKNTPLISIDLIVKNSKQQILLGKRKNEPAKGFWFVPGGRIFKDEKLEDAKKRIFKDELGLEIGQTKFEFFGLYEHFYTNNVFDSRYGTHYIVLPHEILIADTPDINHQHELFQWFDIEDILKDKNVHEYTKDYFR